MPSILETASRELAMMPRDQQRMAIQSALLALPDEQRNDFAEVARESVPVPDQSTSNRIWQFIIAGYLGFMGLAVLTLCVTVFLPPQQGATKPDTILTIFMTASAFLGGLFIPSPLGSKEPKP